MQIQVPPIASSLDAGVGWTAQERRELVSDHGVRRRRAGAVEARVAGSGKGTGDETATPTRVGDRGRDAAMSAG